MKTFLGYPNSTVIEAIYKRLVPTPEEVFRSDGNGNAVVDSNNLNQNGIVLCRAIPNFDGTLTIEI